MEDTDWRLEKLVKLDPDDVDFQESQRKSAGRKNPYASLEKGALLRIIQSMAPSVYNSSRELKQVKEELNNVKRENSVLNDEIMKLNTLLITNGIKKVHGKVVTVDDIRVKQEQHVNHPGTPARKYEEANEYYNLGLQFHFEDYDKAKQCYQKAIKIDAKHSEARLLLGALYEDPLHQFENALKCYEALVQHSPNYAPGHYNLALLLGTQYERYNEAKECYEKAIECDENDVDALCNLGILMEDKFNKYDEAKKYYNKALEVDPDYTNAREKLDILSKNHLTEKNAAKRSALKSKGRSSKKRRLSSQNGGGPRKKPKRSTL